jgi:type IV pilus assembly protein PilV
MKHKNMLDRARAQGGFTLLESLVALLVLSIGLLGIAGLLVQGMRYNQDAYVRTQATILAYDMFDRMRINIGNIAGYTVGAMPAIALACGAPTIALVDDDLRCWRDLLIQTLPGGTATITTPVVDEYQIQMTWVDRNSGTPINQVWNVIITP